MTNAGHSPLRTGFRSFRWASTTTKTPLTALVLGLVAVMAVWLAVAQLTANKNQHPSEGGSPDGASGNAAAAATVQATVSADANVEADRKLQAALADLDHDLADVEDGKPFEQSAGYLVALRRVADMDPGALTRATKDTLDPLAVAVDPESFRGRPFRKMGIIAGIWAVRLYDGDRVNLTDTWRGVLTEPDAEDPIIFDMPIQPPSMRVKRDVVEIEGIFYRMLQYDAERGTRTVPYLLVRSIKIPDTAKLDREFQVPTGFYLVVGVLAIVWVVFRVSTWRKRSLASAAVLQNSIRIHAKRNRVIPERPPEPPATT